MSDHKRITKNSFYLYLRMLLMTGVTLYTSRVILENLGVEDFGIFSVVGGIAVIFSFFNNALSGSTQRFITVSLGKDNLDESRKVYSMSINCHALICLIILLLSETIGVWFLNHELNIPENRMLEANLVFQFALISCLIGVLTVPFSGCIIAYEKMSFFAVTSIISALLKLGIAWIIMYYSGDRLILYSSLLALVSLISAAINYTYCRMKFDICNYVTSRSKTLFRSMMSFTGWNLFKMGAIIGVSQGNNIIVNIFGGPVASAAIAISNQVNGTIYSFMQNVQIAFNPQITKTIAIRNYTVSIELINLSSRISFMFLCVAGVPLILQMSAILDLWLNDVPDATSTLCIFSIISVAADALIGPLCTAVFAKGNIRNYQIVTSILWTVAIPTAWIMMKAGIDFKYILISKIIIQICILAYSLIYLNKDMGLRIGQFLEFEMLRPLAVTFVVTLLGYYLVSFLHFTSLLNIILTVAYTSPFLILGFYFFGLSANEKIYINKAVSTFILSRK